MFVSYFSCSLGPQALRAEMCHKDEARVDIMVNFVCVCVCLSLRV